MSDEVVKDILSGKNATERDRIANRYIERAAELKKTARFSQFLKSVLQDEKMEKRNQLAKFGQATGVQQANFKIGERTYSLNTPGWTVDGSGIYKFYEQSGMIRRACYRPVFPIKVLRNVEDSKEKVKLCYLDGYGHWMTRIFDRALLSSGTKIIQLSSYGLDVTSETSKALVEFLSVIENSNLEKIDRGYSSSKFGWKTYGGEKLFTPYDTDIEFDSEEKFKTLSDSIKEKGDYEKWLKLAKEIRPSGRKEPFVYLVASFSSILVQPLGLLPFIVNLWTETGKGKTVALMFAASVWGNPAEGNLLTDPTTTRTALEQRCTALNNIPMMIDDLSKMKDGVEVDFTNMIYFLCGGKGKERSNTELGVEVVGTWKNCILTNMERPLANETMRGGAVNRVIDFQSEDGSYFMKNGRDQGRAIVETLKSNYGHAGRRFVDVVKQMSPEDLKTKFEGYVSAIKAEAERTGANKEEKQIQPLAALLLTDELIEKHIFLDGQRIDIAWAVSQLKECDEINENQRAYEMLVSWVMANRSTHFSSVVTTEQWGFILDGYVWINPIAFKNLASTMNFSTVALCNWAKKKNLLKFDDEKGVNRFTKKKRDKELGTSNYYVFKLQISESLDFTELSEDEQLELPFV